MANFQGETMWLPDGAENGALAFGAGAMASVVDPAMASPLDLNTAMTLALWVRPRLAEGQRSFVSKDGSYEFEMGHAGNLVYSARLSNIRRGRGGTGLVLGEWQHVAVAWDGLTVRYFYNGVSDGQYSWSGPLVTNDRALGLAGRPPTWYGGSPSRLLGGDLDDVRIYDRALTGVEMWSLVQGETIEDLEPPQRTTPSPTGVLPAATSFVDMSLVTDEAAECRFDTAAGVTFEDMQAVFQSTGGLVHQTPIMSLADGQSYLFRARCRDLAGNTNNDDFVVAWSVDTPPPPGFHPTDLPGVAFFVESIRGLVVAACDSEACLSATRSTGNLPVAQHYCDLDLFPAGCVRRWQDQSGYVPSTGYEPPEWIQGRDFGRAKVDKPGVVPDCLGSHPCLRGGDGLYAARTLELEPDQSVAPTPGAFSVFLVVRPINQEDEFHYFGFAGSELRHRDSDDALRLRIAFGSPLTLTGPGAVGLEAWHVIEIHRGADDSVSAWVDGVDRTVGQPFYPGDFRFRYLMGNYGNKAMHGDIAAAMVVTDALSSSEKQLARGYLASLFGLPLGPGDVAPPVRTELRPTAALAPGTTATKLRLVTNEPAICRWSYSPGTPFDAMEMVFEDTGGSLHESAISGLQDGELYAFYIRCDDGAGNANSDDAVITFEVLAEPELDEIAPIRSSASPSGLLDAGTSSARLTLMTDEVAQCRYAVESGVAYATMTSIFDVSGLDRVHEATVTGLVAGSSHAFFVRCQDAAGNANLDDLVITFQVANANSGEPARFRGAPVGTLPAGTQQTMLSLETNKSAECRYSTTYGQPFSSMTEVFASTGGTFHESPLSGFHNARHYRYYARCQTVGGAANSHDFEVSFFVAGAAPGGFHPTQLDHLEFFVESRHGLQLATCSTPQCLALDDSATLVDQYCDTSIFPQGCVRRWEDQSGHVPPHGFEPPELLAGFDFGQDDADKPGFIANCLNGLPCVRGGVGATQELSFETEPDQVVGPLNGAFSLYLLVRPVDQQDDYYYLGHAGSELRHRVSDNALRLRVAFDDVVTLTGGQAVAPNKWQLIEVHRDGNNAIRAINNGVDVTLGTPIAPGGFEFRHLMSASRAHSMRGDMAAALLVGNQLSDSELEAVRQYFVDLFALELPGAPTGGLVASWDLDSGTCELPPSAGSAWLSQGPSCPAGSAQVIAGVVGGALNFDGIDDLATAASEASLDTLQALTLSAWVRTTETSGWRSIIDKRDAHKDGFDLYLAPGGRPFVRVDTATLTAPASVADGHWHHLVAVWSGSDVRLYVDGQLVAAGGASVGGIATQTPLRVGGHYAASTLNYFAGGIDQIRIYDRALLDPEILALFEESGE